jgi:hypothetical protein
VQEASYAKPIIYIGGKSQGNAGTDWNYGGGLLLRLTRGKEAPYFEK